MKVSVACVSREVTGKDSVTESGGAPFRGRGPE